MYYFCKLVPRVSKLVSVFEDAEEYRKYSVQGYRMALALDETKTIENINTNISKTDFPLFLSVAKDIPSLLEWVRKNKISKGLF